MRDTFPFAVALAIGLALGAGCSKPKPPPKPAPPPRPATAPAAQAADQPAPAPAPKPGHLTLAAPRPGVPPLRLTAVFGNGEQATAGLTDMRDGSEHLVRVGGELAGYRIAAVDPEAGSVKIEKDGATHMLLLDAPLVPPASPPTVPLVVIAATNTARGPLPPSSERFESTPAERARGIDPNDARTWPPDYKGPAIERALQGNQAGRKPDAAPEPAPMDVEIPAVEPTEQEKARGIDPNDPATWPADYKGPTIEDHQTEQAQGATAAGGQPAPAVTTFEPTADERARGIDPNDAKTWPADYKGPTIERALKAAKPAAPEH